VQPGFVITRTGGREARIDVVSAEAMRAARVASAVTAPGVVIALLGLGVQIAWQMLAVRRRLAIERALGARPSQQRRRTLGSLIGPAIDDDRDTSVSALVRRTLQPLDVPTGLAPGLADITPCAADNQLQLCARKSTRKARPCA
jgi:hypothetical protein